MAKQKIFAIFEGGGLKGIAHAGAYDAVCQARSFDFVGVAGSSAGSIVAALIGVRAEPGFIKERLLAKNLQEFLDPEYRDADLSRAQGLARELITGGMFRRATAPIRVLRDPVVRRLIAKKGIHSGEPFVDWFRDLLREACRNPDIRVR